MTTQTAVDAIAQTEARLQPVIDQLRERVTETANKLGEERASVAALLEWVRNEAEQSIVALGWDGDDLQAWEDSGGAPEDEYDTFSDGETVGGLVMLREVQRRLENIVAGRAQDFTER